MRDRTKGIQQEQNSDNLSSKPGYEQTGTSRELNQRGSQQSQQQKNQERGSSEGGFEQTGTSREQQNQRGSKKSQQERSDSVGEQSERSSSDRSRMNDPESI